MQGSIHDALLPSIMCHFWGGCGRSVSIAEAWGCKCFGQSELQIQRALPHLLQKLRSALLVKVLPVFSLVRLAWYVRDILTASYVERIKIGTKIDSIAAGVSRFTTNSAIALVERNWL